MDQTGQASRYIEFLSEVLEGESIRPRDMLVREISDRPLIVNPDFPFMTFEDRKYDVDYFKKEMRWKLGANKYDASIQNHAKIWADVINQDGTYNSNYGQYWFGEQHGFWTVIEELVRDRDSRKAVIPMLNASHMSPQTRDTVCTEGVGFRIRSGGQGYYRLDMSIHMRSSDVIYGLGTDIPTFAFLYRLVLGILQQQYPELRSDTGKITVLSMSSHVYSRHIEMIRKIMDRGVEGYDPVRMPYCSGIEAIQIIASRGGEYLLMDSALGRWLCGE